MRYYQPVVISFLFLIQTVLTQPSVKKPEYDAMLAKRLGADDYGMKQYVMAFLKKGPNRSLSPSNNIEVFE